MTPNRMHAIYPHTLIYYKVHYIHTRARTFATAMRRNLGPIPAFFYHEEDNESVTRKRTPDSGFQISLQLASLQLVRLPLFLSARELLFRLAKSFPPVCGDSATDHQRAGENIHRQTSTVWKYTQWDRAVEFRSPLPRGKGEPHVRTIWLTVLCDISS